MASHPEHRWHATEDDIARLCVYITDDGAVAAYHGCTRERVAKVRAKFARKLRVVPDCTAKSEEHVNASTMKTEHAAEDGSAQLRERLNKFFRKYGRNHGIGAGEAMVVQQYGWGVLNRLKASQA